MNDDKKQRLATAVKWGIGMLAAAIIAPVVFLAVQGLIGLIVAGVLGLALVNFAPVMGVKFANWKLKGLKHEARANPIETRQQIALQVRAWLRAAAQELTTFATEVRNFADEVKNLRVTQPEDAADFELQLSALQHLLDPKRGRLQDAEAEADAFESATARAARKWKVAQSAIRMNKLAGADQDAAMDKLLADESLDAVQTAMNRALAELDTALATSVPQIEHTPAPVLGAPTLAAPARTRR